VGREKLGHALLKRNLRAGSALEIGRRQLEPLLDIPDDGVLQPRPPAFEIAAQQCCVAGRPQRLEQLVDAAQVRLASHDFATERREDRPGRVAYRSDRSLHGIAAEAFAEGQANALEVALRHIAKFRAGLG
jgi:hypothetical protein